MLMLWIIFSLIVAVVYSLSAFVDNYTVDVILLRKRPQCIKVLHGYCYLIIGIIGLIFFGIGNYTPLEIGLIAASGICAALSSIPYYFGLKSEDTTSTAIFLQLSPVLFLIAEAFLFHQSIEPLQYIAFFIILAAPIVIVLSRRRKSSRKLEYRAIGFFLLFVLFYTIASLIFSRAAKPTAAFSAYSIYLIGRGCFDTTTTRIVKSWHRDFVLTWQRKKGQILTFCLTNVLIYTAGEFLFRYSTTIAPASLVSVTVNACELIFTFIFGLILSRIWPKFGREKLARHIIIAHLVATVLAVIGIIILN